MPQNNSNVQNHIDLLHVRHVAVSNIRTSAQTKGAKIVIARNMSVFILGFKAIGLSLCIWAPVRAQNEEVTSRARGLYSSKIFIY